MNKLGKEAMLLAAAVSALRSGKTVCIAAAAEAEAKRLMGLAREMVARR